MFIFSFQNIFGILIIAVVLLIALFFLVLAGISASFISRSLSEFSKSHYYGGWLHKIQGFVSVFLGGLSGFLFCELMAFMFLSNFKILMESFPTYLEEAALKILDTISPFLLIIPLIVGIVIGVVRSIGGR